MKVILSAEIEKLGNAGELVSVKDGYARNFLIPRGLAIRADERNVKQLHHNQRAMEARRVRLKVEADAALKRVDGVGRLVVAKSCGPEGKLFGSVTTREIAELLAASEVEVDRRRIVLNEPLKTLGDFDIQVKLGQGVLGKIQLTIEPDEASAALIAEAGQSAQVREDEGSGPRVSDRAWTGDDSAAGDSLKIEEEEQAAGSAEDVEADAPGEADEAADVGSDEGSTDDDSADDDSADDDSADDDSADDDSADDDSDDDGSADDDSDDDDSDDDDSDDDENEGGE